MFDNDYKDEIAELNKVVTMIQEHIAYVYTIVDEQLEQARIFKTQLAELVKQKEELENRLDT